MHTFWDYLFQCLTLKTLFTVCSVWLFSQVHANNASMCTWSIPQHYSWQVAIWLSKCSDLNQNHKEKKCQNDPHIMSVLVVSLILKDLDILKCNEFYLTSQPMVEGKGQ
jgi:hypothetical protein